MEATQDFRLYGTMRTKAIPCGLHGDLRVIYWEDIEQVFPGVQYIKSNGVTVSMVRDLQGVRIVPHYVKHHPGTVLVVYLSSTPASSSTSLLVPVPKDSADGGITLSSFEATTSPKQSSGLAAISLEGKPPSVAGDTHGREEVDARFIEIQGRTSFQPRTRGQDSSAEVRGNIRTVLARNYELYENPPPRLFIVIPLDIEQWDHSNPRTNRLRLHFICECGGHTMVDDEAAPHCIHFVKHEGYHIARPQEFLQRFGPYIRTIHQMVKHRASMSGITVPDLTHMINAEMSGRRIIEDEKDIAAAISLGMDKINDYVGKESQKRESRTPLTIPDISRLRTFLRLKDEKTLGNMHRMVTTDGYVKWVCKNHSGYSRNGSIDVIFALKSSKSFNDALNAVDVVFKSGDQAGLFYTALEGAKGIHDLKIKLDWNTNYNDNKRLRDTLCKTDISILKLCFKDNKRASSFFDIKNYGRLYAPIIDIMQHSSIRSFTLGSTPTDFFTQSSLTSRDDFTNLRHLELDLTSVDQINSNLNRLVSKALSLSSLVLSMYPSMIPTAYSAMVEYQTYPIVFKEQSMRILPPTDSTSKSRTALQELAHMFLAHGGRIETLDIDISWMDSTALITLAEAIQKESNLKSLSLTRKIDQDGMDHVSRIVKRSRLHKLEISLDEDSGCERILESIQWRHVRELSVTQTSSVQYTPNDSKLREILDCLISSRSSRKEVEGSEPVQLEYFKLDVRFHMEEEEVGLLGHVLSLSQPKHLQLLTTVTGAQLLVLLKQIDVRRLEYFEAWTEYTDCTKVQAILDILEDAPELHTVRLKNAVILPKQKEQMRAKGVSLSRMQE
ncbi:hypothetical protein B0O80DRAFT_429029 [Mortierella sp. GBAus27b]|nr:hypothetical protein BGX31_009271 [Mortierella sp. GBA43]KAI8349619.1 hypothetical protein B0O80DRAFT_429029 [Mortierella sp. GBAus27b]